MAVNASAQNVSAKSQEKQNMQESQPCRRSCVRPDSATEHRQNHHSHGDAAFLFVPLVSMFLFTIRHPLSGKWSFAPWIAIFTGDGSALGADLSTLWSGLGASLALCVVTVLIMLVLLVPTMVIVHIRSRRLERAIEWVATLPLTIPAIVLVVGLGPIYRWLSADVLSTNAIWLCFAYVVLVMPFAFRALAVGLNSIDVKTLCEASRSLGASWPRVFFR